MKKLEINSISSMGGTPVHGCGAADSGLYGETCSAGPGVQRGKDGVYVREVCDILIRDCRILTGDFTIEEHVSVAVKDKIIHAIGTPEELDQRFCAAEVLEADGNLLMPGFIDGHTHTCQQLLRGRTADEYPMIWTRFLVPFESSLSPEDVRASARLHCVEMIRAGITGFADAGGVHMDQVAEAVMETGMRAALCPSTMDMGNVICGEMKHSAEDCIRLTEELHSRYQGAGDGRVDIWFGIRQLMTCSKELIEKIVEKAEELDTGIHMHLCEHKDEVSFCLQNYKMRPAAFLQSVGALSPRLLTAHNVLLTERDITLLTDNGVHVIHCPMANFINHGFPKVPSMLERGASIGIGCDGASNIALDMFTQIRALKAGVTAQWGLPVFDPVAVPNDQLLRMITFGGAQAIRHGDTLGVIEEGKTADLIVIDVKGPHMRPTQRLLNAVVSAGNSHDILHTIIDGKLVMKDRQLVELDEEKIIADAEQHMREINRKSGI